MTDTRQSSRLIYQIALLLIVALLILGVAVPLRATGREDSWSLRDIVRTLEPSVVWVVAEMGPDEWSQGSGFIVHEDGYILTNAHVVDGATEITVGWPTKFNRSDRVAEVIDVDKALDVALLRVPGVHLPTIPLNTTESACIGDAVITLGFPAGEELGLGGLTVTRGVLSSIRMTADGRVGLLQTDAAVTLGCSGGPLFDLDTGTVIGMVQGKGMFLLEGFNFARPISNFFEFSDTLPELGVDTAIAQLSGETDRHFSQPYQRSLDVYRQALIARGQMDWGEALSNFLAATELEDEDPQAAYGAAESYAALDQPRQALTWLERAFELGYSDFDGALDSLGFSTVRDDTRFVDLVESF